MPIKLNKRPDIITSFPFYVDKKEISFAILSFCPFLPLSFLWVLLVPVILPNIVGINYFCMTNVSWGWFNFPSVYFSIIFLVQCASSSSSSTPLPLRVKISCCLLQTPLLHNPAKWILTLATPRIATTCNLHKQQPKQITHFGKKKQQKEFTYENNKAKKELRLFRKLR